MTTDRILLERVEYLLSLADKALKTQFTTEDSFFVHYHVNNEPFNEFATASLSFIVNLYSDKHPYYLRFKEAVNDPTPQCVQAGKGIIGSIKAEIEKGWLITIKGLVSAEIFTDFLETAEYLLEQKYKDAAAVIIGSTLEEHLKQLCRKNSIDVEDLRKGKPVPKKADTINAELSNATVYNKLDQKNITAWLDLRNKAAHGKYKEYTQEQVETMLKGVMEFMTRNAI
ncbi:hypothetical protein SAMN04487891_11716 [Flagellimonas taeanensis]|jgi:hypothetical protein|uniref:RiboL-PSP-HEPN domain-containing protein n=1 Tax=Flagellimonas taeanensis TaxID=1005926 RepID=A0A1M7CRN9_9FLAO|nr:HEPN domain-containing protein [Allomuricauda taeanensis]SFC64924.1 hypothetical protein SAMN04487891_11716 [Allomuricauda taeanensis]SHL69902.1 hypothetical protein SAMN05216293_4099 [Allomuricauda taeanensis]